MDRHPISVSNGGSAVVVDTRPRLAAAEVAA